jgi:hypothetical protein
MVEQPCRAERTPGEVEVEASWADRDHPVTNKGKVSWKAVVSIRSSLCSEPLDQRDYME